MEDRGLRLALEVNLVNDKQHEILEQSRFICTANHGFAPYAQEELRRLFGSLKSSVLVSGEIFLVTLPVAGREAMDRIREASLIFLRHIQPVHFEMETAETSTALEELMAYIHNRSELTGSSAAIQVRKTEGSFWTESAGVLRELLQHEMADMNVDITIQQAEWVISVFASEDHLYAGLSRPEDNLSDWTGGAIRFQREEGQISRAKFKLLEAERIFQIDFTQFENAIDIGAAPGGWTSFLLERGLKVTAVDPALMHESLRQHPKLKVLRKNASEVSFRDNEFDLLVCDMSWSPKQMVKLVRDLLYSLTPGGTAIVTVKLMHKKPMALIKEVISMFEESHMQIQAAKQLFHNRDEITLYMLKY